MGRRARGVHCAAAERRSRRVQTVVPPMESRSEVAQNLEEKKRRAITLASALRAKAAKAAPGLAAQAAPKLADAW